MLFLFDIVDKGKLILRKYDGDIKEDNITKLILSKKGKWNLI